MPFLKLSVPFIRKNTPLAHHKHFLMSYQNIELERRKAGMTNRVIGWTNIIDTQGRIRWQANGNALEHEIDSMITLTKVLLEQSNRIESNKKI